MQEVLINGQWKIKLPEPRAKRPEWAIENGGWEKARLDSMFQTTKPGDVVYYIGTECGDMAGLLSMWGAELILIEPNSRVWPNIKAIWDANNLKDPLYCFEGFVSDKTVFTGKSKGHDGVWPNSIKGEVIGDHGFKELCDPGEISQQTLYDIYNLEPKIHDKPPAMISIDVEGSEGRVLRSGEKLLKRFKPRIYLSLHPEMMMNLYGEYSAELRKWLTDLGYKETLLDAPLHEYHYLYE